MVFITVLNRIYTSKEYKGLLDNLPNHTGYITVGTEDQFFIDSNIIHNNRLPPLTFMLIGVDTKNFKI